PVAAAGPDTSGCFTASGTLFHLHGTGTNGNCSWSVISGTANIASPNSCSTDVTVTSGSATLRLTVTSAHAECSPATDDVVLTVTPLPTCSLSPPNPLPQCASTGNQLCATNTSNVATYFWYITSLDAGWQITGGQGTNCVTYTAGNGGTGATFHLIVTSTAGCKDSCVVRDSCITSGDFCSLTQGAWGNATGKFGNETHLQVEQRVITPANPLVIGIKKSINSASFGSLSFVDGSEDCLILRMPGGGTARTFPSNLGDQTLTDANGCTAGVLTFNSNGRFDNVLIGQTIALSLNTRLDGNLGGLMLSTTMVSGAAGPGPDGKLGTADDVCLGTDLRTVYISSRVLTALQNLGLPKTVGGLVVLCNRALSGLDISPATIGDCNSAADAINEGFDSCRCLVQSSTVADNSGMATGGAQGDPFANGVKDFALAANTPNPFDHSTLIRFGLPVQAHVRVAVYNILGQQVALLTDGDFAPGVQSLVWDAKSHSGAPVAPGVYFARMRADTATRHFVQTRKMLFVK
ncbi:MAG TPA: hypothetical protein VFK69_00455, partial [Candidatus Eisenbacteria bacterium]|nr:hypothetical protein [Candidatus Eisenbacteria bacterium]